MSNFRISSIIAAIFLLMSSGLAAQEQAAPVSTAEPLDSIVAVVEEDVILRSELDRSMQTIMAQIQASGQQAPPESVLREQVLERLAVDRLQLQRADASSIRIADQEIDRYIQQVASQSGITSDQMRQTIIADGITWGEFRSDIRDQLAIDRLRRRVAQSRVNITETEIDLFLEGVETKPGEYRLSHLLISLPEGASPDDIRAGRDRLAEVIDELDGDMPFATAAITYSDGQRALQGGDLGWRRSDEVPPAFAEAIAAAEVGEVTQPIRSPSGFHLLKIEEYRDAQPRMVTEYTAQHLMIEISELMDATSAETKIRELHQQLLDGEDFAELAKEHSDDPTSANLGGDLGWFEPNAYGPAVGQRLEAMEKDALSAPFRSSIGWHLIKHQGKRTVDRTVEFQREEARQAIWDRKAEEEIELWLRQLRDEAFIDYRLG